MSDVAVSAPHECLAIGQDKLHFICSQMNNVYSLFEDYKDTEALNLLKQIEEECC
ncbi:N(2)-fixation sustaining protein CowN [Hyella patelloides]